MRYMICCYMVHCGFANETLSVCSGFEGEFDTLCLKMVCSQSGSGLDTLQQSHIGPTQRPLKWTTIGHRPILWNLE